MIEVARDVSVDHGEALSERAGHLGAGECFFSLRGPVLDGDEVGGGVGVAARSLDPDLPGAQRTPQREQDAQLAVVLVEVLLPGRPGALEVGPPPARDEAG
jgi:hypothetical protein